MKPTRRLHRHQQHRKDQSPVVVTFDEHGGVLDIVGDVEAFVGKEDTVEQMLRRLCDLLVGEGAAETLSAVEVSQGRYADIHILSEGGIRNLVLLNASEVMQVLRMKRQKDNETLLEHRAIHRELRSSLRVHNGKELYGPNDVSFRSGSLLGAIIREMRSPVALMCGHARFLATHLANDAAALKSVAAITDALVRLEALSTARLLRAMESTITQSDDQGGGLHELAVYLQDAFQLQVELRGIEFEVNIAERSLPAVVNLIALRHVLMGLVVHALDGLEQKRLVVSVLHHDKGLDVELETSPCGFQANSFGALLTTRDMLYSNPSASLSLAISQQLLNRLSATIELVAAQTSGYVLWFRIPPQSER